MKFLQQKSRITTLDKQSKQNEIDLDNKKQRPLVSKPNNEILTVKKPVYDSDWVVSELELINGAVSTTLGELLPQRANYEFTFDLNIPEAYLPFFKFDVLAKTSPVQVVKGVGRFNFTSLREPNIQLYDWLGITSATGAFIATTEFNDTLFYPPALPDATEENTGITFPLPFDAYYHDFPIGTYYTTVRVNNVGTGLGPFILSADGHTIFTNPPLNTESVDFQDWIVSLRTTYAPFTNFNYTISSGYNIVFRTPYLNFPLPYALAQTFDLPYGTTTDPDEHSTVQYPSQYWEEGNIVDFDTYVTAVGYDEASDIFGTFYSTLIITEENDGPPYHAYETVITDTVKSCNQQIVITKTGENQFNFNVNGYLLLLSTAITETSWSDPLFPTYEPSGEDLYVRLKVFFDSQLKEK